jgi:hypothetical protein
MTTNRLAIPIGATAVLALFTVVLESCTQVRQLPMITPATVFGPQSVKYKPDTGTSATVQIGDQMFATYNVVNVPVVRVEAPFRHIGNYREGSRMALDIPAGSYSLRNDDVAGGRYFSSGSDIELAYEAKGAFPNPESLRGGFYHSSAGEWSIYWFWSGNSTATTLPVPNLRLTLQSEERPPSTTGFRRELIYTGISQSTLSLVYREFVNDMARPAFSQDLKYDFAKGSVIGYKGARFEIQNADNTSITYRVLATLQPQD